MFQNKLIRQITSYNEISLTQPGYEKCAYFCITSDQDSTFDFLSSLFMSFVFIKLVRYADKYGDGGKLPQMQNRYPLNQWQEIIGNCDTQLFLGCTDELTADEVLRLPLDEALIILRGQKVLKVEKQRHPERKRHRKRPFQTAHIRKHWTARPQLLLKAGIVRLL